MSNTKSKVICIGRQFGSGGLEIAKKLSKELGIPCYDKEVLDEALENTDLPKDILRAASEHKVNPFLHTVFYEGKNKEYYGKDAHTIVNNMQKKIILKKAKQGDCIFVGRCADAVLAGKEDVEVLSVFIAAPLNDRVNRIVKRENLNMKDALVKIKKMDKKRELYYKYFAKKEWGNPAEYDFAINSGRWGIERTAEAIKGIYQRM